MSDYALEQTDGLGDPLMGAWTVRDYYERLIDEGKLRVVEEVEELTWALPNWQCPSCKTVCALIARKEPCPNCGNKVKR